ncbi:MAG: proteasome subunit alpha, partial [Nitrosopumilaceae archaeon]|nr:proteasome subunit alpha [Nitrosopumilaceae archaeon]
VALIISGVDQSGNRIYVTDPSGTFVSYTAVAIGAGADDVNSFLEKNYKDDMSLDDASALAIAAIELRSETKEEKSIKMSRITTQNRTLQKVSDADIEKYSGVAKTKFPKPN